jgi:hypothetical protein
LKRREKAALMKIKALEDQAPAPACHQAFAPLC